MINSSTNAVIGIPIQVGNTLPGGMAVTPDNAFVYVTLPGNPTLGGRVAIVDTAANTPLQVNGQQVLVQTRGNPSQIAITPDGARAWVAEPVCDGCVPFVEVIDTTANPPVVVAPALTTLLNPTAIAISPDGTVAYVADECADPTIPGLTIACLDKVDTATQTLTTQIPLIGTRSSQGVIGSAAIAVTADGSRITMSVVNTDGTLGVAFINSNDNTFAIVGTGQNVSASNYGFGMTPTGTLYAAAPFFSNSSGSPSQIFLFNAAASSLIGTITVGSGPTGIAVSPTGNSVYVTNCCGTNGTLSIIDTTTGAIAATLTVGADPQGVAVMPTILPAITAQPASQTIDYGQPGTLSVTATGTPPLSYQWFQGQSGDRSTPVAGATASSFTVPVLTATTSYWVSVSNLVTTGSAQSNTATLTVNPLSPPVITTQPASVVVTSGQTATLSVVATGTPPLTYQWYQGQSGDISTPVAGAASSTFTITATTTASYWVRITNIATSINSATATVNVNQAPTCTLAVQGTETSDFAMQFTIKAIATCVDPQGSALTTSISWGDGSAPDSGSGGSLIATHTYTLPLDSNYTNIVTATDSLGLQGTAAYSTTLVPAAQVPGVFAGQSADFSVSLESHSPPPPVQVTFECTTVTDSNGNVMQASTLGIECSTTPAVITLASATQSVAVGISTTGAATGMLRRETGHAKWVYAFCLPLPGMIFLGAGYRSRRRTISSAFIALAILALVVHLSSCGGGFTLASKNPANSNTPAVSYQVTVVDSPVNPSNVTGFVQISLIVPITVSPSQ